MTDDRNWRRESSLKSEAALPPLTPGKVILWQLQAYINDPKTSYERIIVFQDEIAAIISHTKKLEKAYRTLQEENTQLKGLLRPIDLKETPPP